MSAPNLAYTRLSSRPSFGLRGVAPVGMVAALLCAAVTLGGCDNPAQQAASPPDGATPTTTSPDAAQAAEPVAGGDQAAVTPAPDAADPQALYAQCRERVEGPQAAGECTTDADCTTGGCSSEICATPAALEGMMSTCEVQPCFAVLASCGCHDGMCTWTVAAPSGGAPPVTLPPKDQLQQPPG